VFQAELNPVSPRVATGTRAARAVVHGAAGEVAPESRHGSAVVIEKGFAAIVLAVCIVLLVRLVLGARRRQRLDAFALRAWYRLRGTALSLWRGPRKRREARRLAEDAIRRASQGQWDGNVYTPEQFKRPPRDKLH
jgi:hypothetical protein